MEIAIQENSQYGLVVSSRAVADELGKRHSDLTRDIQNILENQSPQICGDLKKLIIPSTYKDAKNRTYKEYLLTKDGFTLYMFNIQGYNEFKMAYIQKFNEMEKALYSKKLIKKEHDNIREMDYNGTVRYTKAILNDLKSKLLAQRTEIDEKIKELDRTGLTSKMQSYVSKGKVVVFRDVD